MTDEHEGASMMCAKVKESDVRLSYLIWMLNIGMYSTTLTGADSAAVLCCSSLI